MTEGRQTLMMPRRCIQPELDSSLWICVSPCVRVVQCWNDGCRHPQMWRFQSPKTDHTMRGLPCLPSPGEPHDICACHRHSGCGLFAAPCVNLHHVLITFISWTAGSPPNVLVAVNTRAWSVAVTRRCESISEITFKDQSLFWVVVVCVWQDRNNPAVLCRDTPVLLLVSCGSHRLWCQVASGCDSWDWWHRWFCLCMSSSFGQHLLDHTFFYGLSASYWGPPEVSQFPWCFLICVGAAQTSMPDFEGLFQQLCTDLLQEKIQLCDVVLNQITCMTELKTCGLLHIISSWWCYVFFFALAAAE